MFTYIQISFPKMYAFGASVVVQQVKPVMLAAHKGAGSRAGCSTSDPAFG